MKTSAFALVAQLANTRITLPLTHIETRFRVTGEFAAVEMDQVFEQTARESLDVTYTFPMPENAAVYRCEMIINGRVIRAVVMEEKEARRVVAEKKIEGQRTALVEMTRDNLFTLQLGNTAPGDRIVIRFAYFENLDRLGSQLSLRVPFCPGIRYIPGKPLLRKNRGLGWADDTDQVPDASRLSPPRISSAHPDAATLFLHGTLDDTEVDLKSLSSPTHPATLRSQTGCIEVELAGEEHLPERDFVLRWEETPVLDGTKPKAWVSDHTDASGDTHRYAILQLRAPQADAVTANDDFVQDVYFLLDRSGSMSGVKWEKCAEALHAFVRELGSNDRVWITCFESAFQDFSDVPMLRDEILADGGFQNLADIGATGGTELLPALQHVLKIRAKHSTDRPARLILITDGQVGNESEITRLMRQPDHANLPIHTFGIDTAVNDAFLKQLVRQTGGRYALMTPEQLARQTGGHCTLMTPDDDIPAAVQKLAVTLRRPVLTQLRLEGECLTPRETHDLPDLHAGEVLLTSICVRADLANQIRITARQPKGGTITQTYDLSAAAPDSENPIPRLLWVQRRCRHLLNTDRQADAIQLAIAHNITCRGASFIAWDETEKVSVAKQEVYQPSLIPARQISMSMLTCPPKAPISVCDKLNLEQLEVIDEVLSLYGYRLPDKHDTTVRLATWAHRFASFLREKLSVPTIIASQLAITLRAWAMSVINIQRDQQLETWLAELETSSDPFALLQKQLASAEESLEITYARKLLKLIDTLALLQKQLASAEESLEITYVRKPLKLIDTPASPHSFKKKLWEKFRAYMQKN